MRTQRKKHSRLWVYLLYLGLVTSLILSVTLARYVSTAGGTGTAAVAAMSAAVDGSALTAKPIDMTLAGLRPGGEARTLDFQVVNYTGDTISEVALDYEITVKTTGNLPLTYTLTAEGGDQLVQTGPVLADLASGAAEQTLSGGAFPLTGERQVHTYHLEVTWPREKGSAQYADEIDLVTITVTAWQRLSGEGETTSV